MTAPIHSDPTHSDRQGHRERLHRHLNNTASLLLDAAHGFGGEEIRVTLHLGRTEVVIVLRPFLFGPVLAEQPLSGRGLTDIEESLVRAAPAASEGRTLKGINLARACGLPYNPTTKALIRNLVALGLLRQPKRGGGYHRPASDPI